MRMIRTILAGAGFAALAAAPAAAQYYPYSYSPYAYNYGYSGYGMNTSLATQQCTAAVQSRLYNRTSLGSILGSLFGVPTTTRGQVLNVTSITPTSYGMRVRGYATSGRYAYNSYGPYGIGAYGALGYGYQPDLSYKCDVDYRGYVRDVDINRRY